MKYFEKKAVRFTLEQEEVPKKLIEKELNKSSVVPVAGSAVMGSLVASVFKPQKGIAKNVKNILLGGAFGAGLGSAAELIKKQELQKELIRRKNNPGYR